MENNLKSLRKNIDKIDDEILELFIRRLRIVEDIYEYKKINGMNIYDKKRENEILQKIDKNMSVNKYKSELESLFKSIMKISSSYQEKLLGAKKWPH